MEHETKEMLEAYGKALEDGGLLSPETAKALAEHMEASMAVRDAVLLMAGCGRDVEWVERFLADPQTFKAPVAVMMRKSFKAGPDKERLLNADIALSTMAIAAPHASQPLAVNAYLHWASGDDGEARHMTELALDRDSDNILAGLVATALDKEFGPADLA